MPPSPGPRVSPNVLAPSTTHRNPGGPALTLLLICQLMIILDTTVMNVALPRIRPDLHIAAVDLAWVMNAYTLAFGGLLLLGGRAGDLFGRRKVLMIGAAVFALASLVGGLAPSAGLLLAARAVQGVGGALCAPNALALLTTIFTEPKARTRALALFSGMTGAGFALGLIIGGFLTEWLTWRSVMFINVPFGLLVFALAPRFLPAGQRRAGGLDLPGAITATTGVSAVVFGFIHAASHGWATPATVGPLGVGAALVAAFLVIEIRSPRPLLPISLFTDRVRALAYANVFVEPMAGMSLFFFLTQFLQEIRGASAIATGIAFLPNAVLMFLATRLVPRLLPRRGPRPLVITGTLLMTAGLTILTQLSRDSGYFPLLFGAMVLVGMGMGLAFSPLNVAIMSTVAPDAVGTAGGVFQTLQQTGIAVGLAILTTVFGTASSSGSASAEDASIAGITAAFACAAGLAAIAVVIAGCLPSPGRTNR